MEVPTPLPFDALSRGRAEDLLGSWKAISAYLKRDVSTVQRWEKHEGMPVHRHLHAKRGSVYGYRSELDAWWAGRAAHLDAQKPPAMAPHSAAHAPAERFRGRWSWAALAGAALLVAGVMAAAAWRSRHMGCVTRSRRSWCASTVAISCSSLTSSAMPM